MAAPKQDTGGAGTSGGAGAGGNRVTVTLRKVVKTGQVTLTSTHPAAARERIDAMLARFGGSIDSEQTSHTRQGRLARSTLVLRVPVADFEAAMSALQEIGRTQSAESSARDVTTQVIDVEERVRTLRNSIHRLQRFQQQSANIDDLIRFEQEITDREAELQSQVNQRDYLADQTAMSTITVRLSSPGKATPAATGFLGGLTAGWRALAGSAAVALTVVGAVLPFAVLLTVVGIPVWLLVRHLLRGRRTPAPSGPPPADAG